MILDTIWENWGFDKTPVSSNFINKYPYFWFLPTDIHALLYVFKESSTFFGVRLLVNMFSIVDQHYYGSIHVVILKKKTINLYGFPSVFPITYNIFKVGWPYKIQEETIY